MSAPARTALTRTRLVDPWRVSLWAVQLLLAALFADDGFAKATQPIGALAETFTWPGQVTEGLVRAIGFGELAAAVGLVLPAATRVLPHLTPLAAASLALLMWAAFVFHAMRSEWPALLVNVVLGLLAAYVAWGRFTKAPVGSRFED
jgi:putative oxidoreductase